MTKKAFIESIPLDVPIAEVVARGKEKGLELPEATVRAVRSHFRVRNGFRQRKPRSTKAFVQALPRSIPTREVVEIARAQGITVTEKYVRWCRWDARAGNRKAAKEVDSRISRKLPPKAAAPKDRLRELVDEFVRAVQAEVTERFEDKLRGLLK